MPHLSICCQDFSFLLISPWRHEWDKLTGKKCVKGMRTCLRKMRCTQDQSNVNQHSFNTNSKHSTLYTGFVSKQGQIFFKCWCSPEKKLIHQDSHGLNISYIFSYLKIVLCFICHVTKKTTRLGLQQNPSISFINSPTCLFPERNAKLK